MVEGTIERVRGYGDEGINAAAATDGGSSCVMVYETRMRWYRDIAMMMMMMMIVVVATLGVSTVGTRRADLELTPFRYTTCDGGTHCGKCEK